MVNIFICFHNIKYFVISIDKDFLNYFKHTFAEPRSSVLLDFASALALGTLTAVLVVLTRIILWGKHCATSGDF
jgi:hypothetical protein